MSKEISQEELAEALEHHEDHPVTQEEFEIDEEWIRKMYEQLHKATSIVWKEEQNKIWIRKMYEQLHKATSIVWKEE